MAKLSITRPRQHRPGEYPHQRTGHLRRNIVAEHQPKILTSRVGTNVDYGKDLELGLGSIPRYPWLSLGWVEMMPTMIKIIGEGKGI